MEKKVEDYIKEDSFYGKVLYPDPDKKTKLPIWVHYVLRALLQTVVGFLTWWFWVNDYKFFGLLCGFFFIYHIITLIWGQNIRNALIEIALKK